MKLLMWGLHIGKLAAAGRRGSPTSMNCKALDCKLAVTKSPEAPREHWFALHVMMHGCSFKSLTTATKRPL
eukprot:1161922-Pelagomonas_calceolata.AAC.2